MEWVAWMPAINGALLILDTLLLMIFAVMLYRALPGLMDASIKRGLPEAAETEQQKHVDILIGTMRDLTAQIGGLVGRVDLLILAGDARNQVAEASRAAILDAVTNSKDGE